MATLLLTWLPLLFFIVLWIYFMRGSGTYRMRSQMDRSMEHMDKLERLNEEMLASLRRIEDELGKRR